jgi:hypothetical protein
MFAPEPSFFPVAIARTLRLWLFTHLPIGDEERLEKRRGYRRGVAVATRVTTMSFTGTQDKCTACDKTVHFIDLLTADGVIYHKTCFKCSHCKGILSVRACVL